MTWPANGYSRYSTCVPASQYCRTNVRTSFATMIPSPGPTDGEAGVPSIQPAAPWKTNMGIRGEPQLPMLMSSMTALTSGASCGVGYSGFARTDAATVAAVGHARRGRRENTMDG